MEPKKLTKKEQHARAAAISKKLTDYYSCFKTVKKTEINDNLDPMNVTKKLEDSPSKCEALVPLTLQSCNVSKKQLMLPEIDDTELEAAFGGVGAGLVLSEDEIFKSLHEETLYSSNFNDLSTTFEELLINDHEYEDDGQQNDKEDKENDESEDFEEYLTESQIEAIIG